MMVLYFKDDMIRLFISLVGIITLSAGDKLAAEDIGGSDTTPIAGDELSLTRSYFATVVDVPMRDGTLLRGNLITPGDGRPAPVVVAATPYGRHLFYPIGKRFVEKGLSFLMVDVRGRGDSQGDFAMFYGDKQDMVDLIDWARRQRFSNGKVATWGASYGGYNQWMAAAKKAPGLVTIVPAAAVYPGYDFPMVLNVGYPYSTIWTGFTKGRNANFPLFNDSKYWREAFTQLMISGRPFRETDEFVGFDSELFDEWVDHPYVDDYWRGINPSSAEMAAIDLPVLSITGLYDGAQIGALRYYNEHLANLPKDSQEQHYLIIGPYDHGAVHAPKDVVAGLPIPERGGIDTLQLISDWYAWHLMGGEKPSFLKNKVMYYVMGEGANEWRSAPSLEAIPVESRRYQLSATRGQPTSIGSAGDLTESKIEPGRIHYRFDPRDISKAPLAVWHEGNWARHSADVDAIDGEAFIFETTTFEEPAEIIGRPKFHAKIGITTPDADFQARLYEILADGSSVYLSEIRGRARYRRSREKEELITNSKELDYEFDDFNFVSRRIQRGSRLRFVFGPPNSIYIQRNYNSGKPVSEEVPNDALPTKVSMLLGGKSAAHLIIPMRQVGP